jgi:hypothetical protein
MLSGARCADPTQGREGLLARADAKAGVDEFRRVYKREKPPGRWSWINPRHWAVFDWMLAVLLLTMFTLWRLGVTAPSRSRSADAPLLAAQRSMRMEREGRMRRDDLRAKTQSEHN